MTFESLSVSAESLIVHLLRLELIQFISIRSGPFYDVHKLRVYDEEIFLLLLFNRWNRRKNLDSSTFPRWDIR